MNLFETKKEWEKEWQDMPEFVQMKQENGYTQIVFKFRSEEDLQQFAALIGQSLTKKTKSAWFPQLERGINSNKRYTDES